MVTRVLARVVDEQHEMRVADAGGIAAVGHAVVGRLEVEKGLGASSGITAGSKVTGPMSTVAWTTLPPASHS